MEQKKKPGFEEKLWFLGLQLETEISWKRLEIHQNR
jgi:hypothetical protein